MIGRQTPGVRSRLGGYLYECNVAALRMADVLRGRASAVVLERRYAEGDHFDDIKVVLPDELHAYQVKWGMRSQEDLSWQLFVGREEGTRSDFALSDLLDAYRGLRAEQPDRRVILHVYTTR